LSPLLDGRHDPDIGGESANANLMRY